MCFCGGLGFRVEGRFEVARGVWALPKGSNVVPFRVSYRGFWYTTPKRYYIGASG